MKYIYTGNSISGLDNSKQSLIITYYILSEINKAPCHNIKPFVM